MEKKVEIVRNSFRDLPPTERVILILESITPAGLRAATSLSSFYYWQKKVIKSFNSVIFLMEYLIKEKVSDNSIQKIIYKLYDVECPHLIGKSLWLAGIPRQERILYALNKKNPGGKRIDCSNS